MSREDEVLKAAAELVRAFGTHDSDGYFACFSSDATFIFHSTPQALGSREAYQALWREWEADGFQVLGCRSSDGRALVHGEVAAFTHRVETHLRVAGEEHQLQERETIVFRREGGHWLAFHEHLSGVPAG
ncbi:YybH family protein [Pseudomonas sp. KNUC1026]|uniref:YybH family protein n=1 Tax=Pseudomonas sp. KNUC1026 TaxID=2893890 RepID=UPI001F4676D7|nr:nuclear transport factor 2 family protein [Pseudomonas sp. KNUC1026]UFH49882.1 nuclear transport factor 2 family protein [Pseudomonas sp. KNUC1026]